MHPFNRDDVDPSVTNDELDQAQADPATVFPDVDEQDTLDDEDEDGQTAVRALIATVPATPHQAILNARTLRDQHTFVRIGMCLNVVRGRLFHVPALWPDAATAMRHSSPFHPITDPNSTTVPRGAVGYAANGRHGHVWLELGGGLVSTTDYHELGFEGVALRSKMLTWCGATRWGWGETLNGFDVWPDPVRKPAPPAPWTTEQRIRVLRREQAEAKKAGQWQRATRFDQWADRLEKRLSR